MLARGLLTCDAHRLDRHSLNKDSARTASCEVGSVLGEQTRAKRLEKEGELPSGVTGGNDMGGGRTGVFQMDTGRGNSKRFAKAQRRME